MVPVLLSSIAPPELARLKSRLTVTSENYFNKSIQETTKFFLENQDHIWIPRFYTVSTIHRSLNPAWKIPSPSGPLTIDGVMMETEKRPQQTVFHKTLEQLQKTCGATIVLPPGTGKTNIAIALALSLGQKTAILCHKNFLLEQWRSRIKSFVKEDVKIGVIQQGVCDTDDCDFVLCSIQSLVSKRQYPLESLFFGLVIVDEAHHIPAATFSTSLQKLQYFYSLALTATPKRSDGQEDMIYFLLGFPSYVHEIPVDTKVVVNLVTYTGGACKEEILRTGVLNCSKMITMLTLDEKRNDLLISIIKNIAPGRKGLLLSDRVNHLQLLYSRLDPETTAIITGSVNTQNGGKKTKGEQIFEKSLTLSTFQMFSEAVDFDGDYLILSTPKSNVEQAVGRIMRGKNPNMTPLIFDIIDPFSLYIGQKVKRIRFYKKRGYTMMLDCPGYVNAGARMAHVIQNPPL
jgi:superfamily II DNA or RNA helicase